jgi:hypothetical protein
VLRTTHEQPVHIITEIDGEAQNMPRYVIERQYLLPMYEQLLIEAPDLEAACRVALDEIAHPWSENAEQDFDNARPVTVTEAVRLPEGEYPELQPGDERDRLCLGDILYNSGLDLLAIPIEFADEADVGGPIGFS